MSSAPHVQIHVFDHVFSAETVLIKPPPELGHPGMEHVRALRELELFSRDPWPPIVQGSLSCCRVFHAAQL